MDCIVIAFIGFRVGINIIIPIDVPGNAHPFLSGKQTFVLTKVGLGVWKD